MFNDFLYTFVWQFSEQTTGSYNDIVLVPVSDFWTRQE